MNLTLHLSQEIETRLKRQAALAGKPPEALILEAIESHLSSAPDETNETAELSADEWLARFDEFIRGHRSRNPNVDDSRAGIYSER